jgi:hypothetical protein
MVQSEALRKAKARYYQKKKEQDPIFVEQNRLQSKQYYESNKEKHHKSCMKYYEANKDKISTQLKEKRDKKKVEEVTFRLQQIEPEQLAKILIEARKTKLLENANINIQLF